MSLVHLRGPREPRLGQCSGMTPEGRGHPSQVERDLDWDGCVAIRDLGGLPTPLGRTAFRVFVRGDNARNLTARGWEDARDYGIRAVLDLRSATECESDRPLPSDIAYKRVSLFAHYDDDPAYRADLLARLSSQDIASKYRTLYTEALDLDRARIADAFAALIDAPGAVLFHCVGGKDRTCVVAALLLRLVGVPMQDVETDYMHTEARAQGLAGSPHIDQSAPAEVITQVLAALETQSGSIHDYLLSAGVSAAQVSALAEKLLGNGSTP
jgi:protein-tyrosine phosphatase